MSVLRLLHSSNHLRLKPVVASRFLRCCTLPILSSSHSYNIACFRTLSGIDITCVLARSRLLVASRQAPPWLPGFQLRSGHVSSVVDTVALGQVFSEYFRFPYQFSFYQMLQTHLSFGAGTIGQLVADVTSALSQPHHTKNKRKLL
jgi:hypothetical protein